MLSHTLLLTQLKDWLPGSMLPAVYIHSCICKLALLSLCSRFLASGLAGASRSKHRAVQLERLLQNIGKFMAARDIADDASLISSHVIACWDSTMQNCHSN